MPGARSRFKGGVELIASLKKINKLEVKLLSRG